MIPLQYHELMSFSQRCFAFYSAKVQLCKVKYLRERKRLPWRVHEQCSALKSRMFATLELLVFATPSVSMMHSLLLIFLLEFLQIHFMIQHVWPCFEGDYFAENILYLVSLLSPGRKLSFPDLC